MWNTLLPDSYCHIVKLSKRVIGTILLLLYQVIQYILNEIKKYKAYCFVFQFCKCLFSKEHPFLSKCNKEIKIRVFSIPQKSNIYIEICMQIGLAFYIRYGKQEKSL